MAISHLCLQCGFDLARVRPQRDPHYGLPLVHCPECEAVAVRRRHPVWRGWREGRRVARSLIILLFKGWVTVVLIVATTGSIAALPLFYMEEKITWTDFTRIIVPWFILLALFTGFWITVCFQHWKRREWRAWMILMYPAFQITVPIVYHDMIGPPFRIIEGVHHFSWGTIMTYIFYPFLHYILFLVVMVVAVAGKPLGWGWLRYVEYYRCQVWVKRRKKLRLARNS